MRHLHGGNDEYFTRDSIAESLVNITLKALPDLDKEVVFIEPSAGRGAFLVPLRSFKTIAYDINPQYPDVIKADFLTAVPEVSDDHIYITIGNPPFGFACSLAVKFFNRSAEFSKYIAFIVPRTFRKKSIHNKLDRRFHLIEEFDLPRNSFILNDEPYSVPCIFQIWEKRTESRPTYRENLSKYLVQVPKTEADFAMRRVGGRAGQILDGFDYQESSTYFFKEIIKGSKERLLKADFSYAANSTAGVRSISKYDIYEFLEENAL